MHTDHEANINQRIVFYELFIPIVFHRLLNWVFRVVCDRVIDRVSKTNKSAPPPSPTIDQTIDSILTMKQN